MTSIGPLATNWWMIAARGVLALMLGGFIALWRLPGPNAIIVPFGVYAAVDGVLAIVSALRTARPWVTGWPIVLEGIASLLLGGLALAWPSAPGTAFVLLAACGLLAGFFEIVAAACVPWEADAHWFLMGGGASSVLLAVIVFAMREGLSDPVALLLGVCAIVFGLVMLGAALGFRWATQLDALATSARSALDRRTRA